MMTPEQKKLNGILLRLHTTARNKQRREFMKALEDLDESPDDVDFEIRFILREDGTRIKMFNPGGQKGFVTCVNDSTDQELLEKYDGIYRENQSKGFGFWDVFKTEYDMTEDEFQWVIGGL